jgi:two-component system, NtrC family, sensor kinase
LENIFKKLKLSEETNNIYSIDFTLYKIGLIYQAMGQISSATGYFFKSLKIAEDKGFRQLQIFILNSLGNIHITQKKYENAYRYINQGLTLSKQIGSLEQIQNSYENLIKSDSVQGNFKEALKHYRLYVAIGDSIINNENTKKAMQVQMQYDFDKKHVADSLKFAQEKEITELKLQKQKVLTYGGFAGIAITVILLYFLYRNYNRQRIANQKLKAAQEQLIKSEKMAAFGVVATRMAHEIHNPLNFVNNFSQLSQELVIDVLESQSEEDKKQHAELLIANLKKINEHGKRAAGIVKQLEEHSTKGTAHEFFE